MEVTQGRQSDAGSSRSGRSSGLLEAFPRPFGTGERRDDGGSTLSAGPTSRAYLEALADLTERWERGESPGAERYLDGPSDWTASQAVELIYREYRLAEIAGRRPSADAFLARFPAHREALERLFRLDGACSDSLLGRLFRPRDDDAILPRTGDEIGPYLLKRELGRGGFARVFLAEQADLENRLVVVKVSTRPTREPWLLARARHANIVEILSHAEVDDGALQMICMPFRGGAPLSAILGRRREATADDEGRRRLLDAFETVAAPEHPPTRAARERLAAMTDHQAFAWMVARLAEGLDHAYAQGVAHGDVKPSNVLLTADGDPMLLDFNLARDWSFQDAETPVEDPGGTLAYMAPERLRVMASTSRGRFRGRPDDSRRPRSPNPEESGSASAAVSHRADVYSLGVVLLEAVSGWSPVDDDDDRGAGPIGRRSFREAADLYASIRDRGAAEVLRRAEAAGGATVPPDLRSILIHCLEADPSARYARGSELAEDLDRWRANLPLVFAPEPSRRVAIARWLRRNRRGASVAVFAIVLSSAVAAVFNARGNWLLDDVGQGRAVDFLGRQWDDPASRAYHYQRVGFPASRRRDQLEETAAAIRALKDYKVLESVDWRTRDDFRYLPRADREDLELWLIEQAYRAGLALSERPDSPDDWRRARTIIDRACGAAVPQVMVSLRDRLEAQLAAAGVEPLPRETTDAPSHVEEYLLGAAAELNDAEAAPGKVGPGMTLLDPRDDPWAVARQPEAEAASLAEALRHYQRLLTLRPGSFWGHYRAAAIAFRLRRWGEAAAEIETCLLRRPNNPILQGFLAACLLNLNRSDAALEASNQALDAAPDHAEFVHTRAFIRAGMRKSTGLEADLQRFEMLRSLVPESFFRTPTIMDLAAPSADAGAASRRGMPLARPRKSRRAPSAAFADADEIDPGELTARAVLAARLRETGKTAIASIEIDKILAIDPSYIVARADHMYLAILERRFVEARDDLDLIVDDPRLSEFVASSVQRANLLMSASRLLALEGEIGDALKLAKKTLNLIREAGKASGRAYYMMAAVEGLAARTEPNWLPLAAKHLELAVAAHRDYEQWFLQDPAFAAVRTPIRAMLEEAGAKP